MRQNDGNRYCSGGFKKSICTIRSLLKLLTTFLCIVLYVPFTDLRIARAQDTRGTSQCAAKYQHV